MTRLEACLPRREDARATIGAGLSYPRAHRPCRFWAHHGPLPTGGTPTPHHQRPLREPGTPWGAQASRLSRRASRPVPEHWSSEHGNIVNGQFEVIKKRMNHKNTNITKLSRTTAGFFNPDGFASIGVHSRFHPSRGSDCTLHQPHSTDPLLLFAFSAFFVVHS